MVEADPRLASVALPMAIFVLQQLLDAEGTESVSAVRQDVGTPIIIIKFFAAAIAQDLHSHRAIMLAVAFIHF